MQFSKDGCLLVPWKKSLFWDVKHAFATENYTGGFCLQLDVCVLWSFSGERPSISALLMAPSCKTTGSSNINLPKMYTLQSPCKASDLIYLFCIHSPTKGMYSLYGITLVIGSVCLLNPLESRFLEICWTETHNYELGTGSWTVMWMNLW